MNNDFLLNLRLSNLEKQLQNLIELYGNNPTSLPSAPSVEEQAAEQSKCEILGVRLNRIGGMWLSDEIQEAEPHLGDEEHYNGICPKFSKYLMYIAIKDKRNRKYKRYLATLETTVTINESIPLISDNKTCLEISNLVDCKDFAPASIRFEFRYGRGINDNESDSFINGLVDYFKTQSIESGDNFRKFFEDEENKDIDRFKTMAISLNTNSVGVDVFSGIYKEDTIEDLKHDFCLECGQVVNVREIKEEI